MADIDLGLNIETGQSDQKLKLVSSLTEEQQRLFREMAGSMQQSARKMSTQYDRLLRDNIKLKNQLGGVKSELRGQQILWEGAIDVMGRHNNASSKVSRENETLGNTQKKVKREVNETVKQIRSLAAQERFAVASTREFKDALRELRTNGNLTRQSFQSLNQSQVALLSQMRINGRGVKQVMDGMSRNVGASTGLVNSRISQVSFAVQDFTTVLMGGAGLDRAALAASNNVGALSMGMGPLAIGIAGVAAIALPPLLGGLGTLIEKYSTSTKAGQRFKDGLSEQEQQLRSLRTALSEMHQAQTNLSEAQLPASIRSKNEVQRKFLGEALREQDLGEVEPELTRLKADELRRTPEFGAVRDLPNLKNQFNQIIEQDVQGAIYDVEGAGGTVTQEDRARFRQDAIKRNAELKKRIDELEPLERSLQATAKKQASATLIQSFRGDATAQDQVLSVLGEDQVANINKSSEAQLKEHQKQSAVDDLVSNIPTLGKVDRDTAVEAMLKRLAITKPDGVTEQDLPDVINRTLSEVEKQRKLQELVPKEAGSESKSELDPRQLEAKQLQATLIQRQVQRDQFLGGRKTSQLSGREKKRLSQKDALTSAFRSRLREVQADLSLRSIEDDIGVDRTPRLPGVTRAPRLQQPEASTQANKAQDLVQQLGASNGEVSSDPEVISLLAQILAALTDEGRKPRPGIRLSRNAQI